MKPKSRESKLYRLQQFVVNNRWIYALVLIINLAGAVYGFYWYRNQLAVTPLQFWIFTPDCPGAVFLFLIWALLIALKLPNEGFRVIAITALIKYGIWTVSVIGLLWIEHGINNLENVMLFVSHIGMLIQGVVFAAKMKLSKYAFWFTAFWLLLNDFVDYYFKVHPWLPDYNRLPEIRVGTFILTSFMIIWMFYIYRKTVSQEIKKIAHI